MIPIQITNDGKKMESTNMGQGFGLINGRPGTACKGFNGNLNSWYFGLSPEFKERMENAQNSVGILAQFDTVNSPYYTSVQVDPNYIKFLQGIANCNR
uniref:Uncharacterized protein n=1 Tax=viral metagenome TaxID=1070528 RepID=A0A6C0LG75_9ZZZZ